VMTGVSRHMTRGRIGLLKTMQRNDNKK